MYVLTVMKKKRGGRMSDLVGVKDRFFLKYELYFTIIVLFAFGVLLRIAPAYLVVWILNTTCGT